MKNGSLLTSFYTRSFIFSVTFLSGYLINLIFITVWFNFHISDKFKATQCRYCCRSSKIYALLFSQLNISAANNDYFSSDILTWTWCTDIFPSSTFLYFFFLYEHLVKELLIKTSAEQQVSRTTKNYPWDDTALKSISQLIFVSLQVNPQTAFL